MKSEPDQSCNSSPIHFARARKKMSAPMTLSGHFVTAPSAMKTIRRQSSQERSWAQQALRGWACASPGCAASAIARIRSVPRAWAMPAAAPAPQGRCQRYLCRQRVVFTVRTRSAIDLPSFTRSEKRLAALVVPQPCRTSACEFLRAARRACLSAPGVRNQTANFTRMTAK